MQSRTRGARITALLEKASIVALAIVAAALVFYVVWGATHGAQLD